MSEVQYPVYRKYAHNRTFFRIASEESFEELQFYPRAYTLDHFVARIYPDFQRIQDMLINDQGHWVESSEEEWLAQLKRATNDLEKVG